MPDDRLFHKRLGHSEKVTKLTDFEYIVWHAYVLSADDFGVLRFTAIALQADHDRLASKSATVIQRALKQVCAVGLLATFLHQGQVYAYQGDWQDWQHVDYPRATLHPMPPESDLLLCSEATRRLFEIHPGGWRGKKGRNLPAHLPKVSDTPPETFGTPSATPTRKPLAVSQEPLAVSRQPEPGLARRAEMTLHRGGHQRHAWCSERICVPDFTHERLSRQLGRPDADSWLRSWYPRVVDQVRDSPIGDKPEDFWPRQFAIEFPPQGQGVSKLTAALEKASDW